MKLPKQAYTAEFKKLAVTRVKDGLTAGAAAKELGLIEQTLRNWVKAAAAGRLNGARAKGVRREQMELSRLRAENVRLRYIEKGRRGLFVSATRSIRLSPQ